MPPPNYVLLAKCLAAGGAVAIGGPWLLFKALPDPEAEFEKYAKRLTPSEKELVYERKRRKDEEFDHYVTKLKEYAKVDKPIWIVQQEDFQREHARKLRAGLDERKRAEQEAKTQKEDVRRAAGLPPSSPTR